MGHGFRIRLMYMKNLQVIKTHNLQFIITGIYNQHCFKFKIYEWQITVFFIVSKSLFVFYFKKRFIWCWVSSVLSQLVRLRQPGFEEAEKFSYLSFSFVSVEMSLIAQTSTQKIDRSMFTLWFCTRRVFGGSDAGQCSVLYLIKMVIICSSNSFMRTQLHSNCVCCYIGCSLVDFSCFLQCFNNLWFLFQKSFHFELV